ncbi:MAG: alanine--tRNA ligase [Sulfolobales archaeon]|nr:alanine--tRNA ligase [Sulfolobales archaeon]
MVNILKVSEPELSSKFLESLGYVKYRCRVCGEEFYSLLPRTTCPDSPCSKYEFLYNDYSSIRRLDVESSRRAFIDFFTRNNHGYVEPYPVIAKWRDDLYLTIASIVVFQPAVTEGISEPPYNPLVIVQPCIRLEDIDYIGMTFGRHLTSFEMGGHHAFNSPNKSIYWVDETIEYAFKFFSEEIGVPPELMAFKPSWWEGGGNAGPAYEVLVGGLEVATLVFMKYRSLNGSYEPMKLKVVDTGYGVERVSWLTERTPTAFHAIYGGLVNKFFDILGLEELDYELLKKITYETSDSRPRSFDELSQLLSQKDLKEYYNALVKNILTYTLLDHYKTLLLLLSDGVVPSNTGEGYLARLVLRRSLRTMHLIGVELRELNDVVQELLSKLIDYFKDKYVYSKFYKYRNYITEVVSEEVKKYIDTLERGMRVIDKIIVQKGGLTEGELVELYDSYGIPPEIVRERALNINVQVVIPREFYANIAKKHSQAVLRREITDAALLEFASLFPETKALFHEYPYETKFTAKIIGVKGSLLILDQTLFYPASGGQDHDVGFIYFSDGRRVDVRRVLKVGNVIIHELGDAVNANPGEAVVGEVDWLRRYKLMRHHTATHIVLASARRVLGEHVNQAGAEKTVEKARLDITHYRSLSRDELRRIEEVANSIIDDRISIKVHHLGKFDAEKKFGIGIYQGGSTVAPVIRIVEIPGWDAQACYGTHLQNTGEVGCIKIVDSRKIQDGVLRLEFVAGTNIGKIVYELEGQLEEASLIIGSSPLQLKKSLESLVKERDELRNYLAKYRVTLSKLIMKELEQQIMSVNCFQIVHLIDTIGDEKLYRDLILHLVGKGLIVIYESKGNYEIAEDINLSRRLDLTSVLKEVSKNVPGVRGGGKKDHVSFRASASSNEVLRAVVKAVMEIGSCAEN